MTVGGRFSVKMLNNSKYRIRILSISFPSMLSAKIGGFWMYMKVMAVFLHLSRISLFDADINSSGIFIMSSFVLFLVSPSISSDCWFIKLWNLKYKYKHKVLLIIVYKNISNVYTTEINAHYPFVSSLVSCTIQPASFAIL